MTKFQIWKINIINGERRAVLFDEEPDLKSAYDLIGKLSEFIKDIKLVISEIDDAGESDVGNIVEIDEEMVKIVIYNIEQISE